MPAPDSQQHVSLVIAPAQGPGVPTDITVYVDGHAVPGDTIRAHRASASLVLLVDDSGEMEERGLSPVADGLLQALAHGVDPHADRLGAIRFSDEVTPLYDYASPPSFIKRRGLRLEPTGSRCLNLAVEAALTSVLASPMPSKAVLLATSGEDSAGSCGGPDRDSVISAANAAGVPVHVVHLGPTTEPQPQLERLASDTGGAFWVLGTTDSLDSLATEIAALLAAPRYVTFKTESAATELVVDVRANVDGAALAGIAEIRPSDGGPLLTALIARNDLSGSRAAGQVAGGSGSTSAGGPSADSPAAVPIAAAASGNRWSRIGMVAAAGLASAVLVLRRRRVGDPGRPSALASVRARVDAERRAAEDSAVAASAVAQVDAQVAPTSAAGGNGATVPVASLAGPLADGNAVPVAEDSDRGPVAPLPAPVSTSAEARSPDDGAPDPLPIPGTAVSGAAATTPLAMNGHGPKPATEGPRDAVAAPASRRPQSAERLAANPLASATEPPPFALVGFVCGRYRLEAPLGRGGLGEVYRARDLQFDRTVAVKVLYDTVFEGADAFDSLMREVSLVDRITHPNVVRVYDVIRFEGRVAIVMEYVSGQSLAAITREQGTVSPEDFDAVLTGVAEALDAAHAAGVVHGDVTPGNVLITDEGKVKLCDFGVGRLVGDDPSAPRAGTPRFVAPEVFAGADAGPRGDVFSLGALTLHMIAGRDADVTALPAPFARALEGALEPEPNMRCASAGALAVAFHAAVEEEIMRRRGPVRRLVDGFRLRAVRRAQPSNRVDLPPTVSFPMLQEDRDASAFLDDPDRTQPLPPATDTYLTPLASGVTQPLGTRE